MPGITHLKLFQRHHSKWPVVLMQSADSPARPCYPDPVEPEVNSFVAILSPPATGARGYVEKKI